MRMSVLAKKIIGEFQPKRDGMDTQSMNCANTRGLNRKPSTDALFLSMAAT